jgi:Domain of unknown function (DUF4406)
MRIYLAGPMTGIPEFNFPAFNSYAYALRKMGHVVFNPAERDIQRHGGVDISIGNETGCQKVAAEVHGFSLRDALADDCEFICKNADAIAMMPGWENSAGAMAEWHLAKALKLKFLYL